MTAESRGTMLDLVRHLSASLSTIASVLNTTYGLYLLGRDECHLYRVKVAVDNTLEGLFFCKPDDVKARVYGQMVIIDATYKTNRFR
ncbi:hypothetical protein V1523DRAFT_59366 [Lipomyces doorenjongii]